MAKFTPFQRQAIHFKKGNCLVSAGAGSGKTAVLTERIYWLLVPPLEKSFAEEYQRTHNGEEWSPDDLKTEPVFDKTKSKDADPSELLVLTFSNAAAFEMKDRVRKKFAAHAETRPELPKIENSELTTFDSFNLRLVNSYHYELGLKNPVSILDESYLLALKHRFLKEALERRYAKANRGEEALFSALIKAKCKKDDSTIVSFINEILRLSELSADPLAFLSSYEESYFNDAFLEKAFQEVPCFVNKGFAKARKRILTYENSDLADLDLAWVDNYLSKPQFEDKVALYLSKENPFPRKKKGMGDQDDSKRENVKDLLKPVFVLLSKTKQDHFEQVKATYPYIRLCLEIAKEVETSLNKWMEETGYYTFAGVASLAYKVLSISEIAEKIKAKYRFVMVDEYQDTSDLQENLLTLLSEDNLFAVGDIKQSIYRFRYANPKIFANRLDLYSQGKGGKLITLPDNFRSRSSVLKAINELFLSIMSEEAGGVDYSKNHALKYGNTSFDASEAKENYGLEVLDFKIDKAIGSVCSQAEAIAKDIALKLSSKYLVKKDKDGARPCQVGDFAVLVSRKTGFQEYVRAFKEAGIPVSVVDETNLKRDDLVLCFLSFLRLIRAFVEGRKEGEIRRHCLSLARSFLFAEDDENNHRLFLNEDYNKLPFVEQIKENAETLIKLDITSLFSYFADSFHLFERFLSLGNVKENSEKYLCLLNKAKSFEKLGLSSMDFLSYLEELDTYDGKFSLKLGGREKNAVVLMSIHASKGLQFPICYYSELAAPFRFEKGSWFASKDYGICLPSLEDSSEVSFLETLLKANSNIEERNERMRLFYVALTRAEELMVLLSPKPEIDEKTGETKTQELPEDASSANSFLTFFALANIAYPRRDIDALPKIKLTLSSDEKTLDNGYTLSLDSVSIPFEKKAITRPSKELHEPLDPSILLRGSRLHRYMEFVDFAKKDIPFLEEGKEKQMLLRVLSLPLFEKASEAKQFHEYSFFDEENGTSGVIDCFLVYEDHIDLIDFKTNTLDENAYQGQLDAYASFLGKAFPGKRIDKYLLSLSKATLKRVS